MNGNCWKNDPSLKPWSALKNFSGEKLSCFRSVRPLFLLFMSPLAVNFSFSFWVVRHFYTQCAFHMPLNTLVQFFGWPLKVQAKELIWLLKLSCFRHLEPLLNLIWGLLFARLSSFSSITSNRSGTSANSAASSTKFL